MKVADLYPAYGWTCDECGKDNVAPMVDIEKVSFSENMKGEVDEDGPKGVLHVCFCPKKTVKCVHCGIEFKVEEAAAIV